MTNLTRNLLRSAEKYAAVLLLAGIVAVPLRSQTAQKMLTWKPVPFAIIRFNDDAPRSWNIYHGEKHGLLLVRLWKRYMLVNVAQEEVFDIDPDKVTINGENAQWAESAKPNQPIDTSEWKIRDAGTVERIRFRFGKTGHFMDIQLPLLGNGKTQY